MGEVIIFPGVTKHDLEADQVLRAAISKLETVVIVGYDKDGEEYFASSVADGADASWLLDRAKKKLLDIVDEETGGDCG